MTTTANALRATILANPHEHAPRLVLSDWLEEHGECDRAEFIRVQCELATYDPPRGIKARPQGMFGDELDREFHKHGKASAWGKNRAALRRREAELLAKTSSEPCQRVLFGGKDDDVSDLGGCGFFVSRGGPDYFDSQSSHRVPVGSRVDVRYKDVNSKWKRAHGLLVRKADYDDRGGNPSIHEYVLKRDELSVPGPNVVQISNACRWAGKLGGREAIAIDRPNEFVERSRGWHVRWLWPHDNISDHEIFGRFALGFIGHVSLSCAALMGERCPNSGPNEHHHNAHGCSVCHGSGYVGGMASELARFPLLGITLADKRPECSNTNEPHWGPKSDGRDMPCELPRELYDLLPEKETSLGVKIFDSPAAANAALSAVCCRLVRQSKKELVPA